MSVSSFFFALKVGGSGTALVFGGLCLSTLVAVVLVTIQVKPCISVSLFWF